MSRGSMSQWGTASEACQNVAKVCETAIKATQLAKWRTWGIVVEVSVWL